jgi:hypothetical protein
VACAALRRGGCVTASLRARSAPGAARPDPAPPRSRASGSERVLYGTLLVLAVLGVLSPGQFNVAPADSLLEVVFLVTTALLTRRVGRGARTMLVVGGLYVLVKTVLLLAYGSASITDFLLAYKSFFYLIMLAFFVGKSVFDTRRLATFTTVLVGAFLVKYGYSVALGLDDRPGVYLENNFELIMLMGLVYLAHPYLGRRKDLVFLGLAATVLLSGSRSAALGLLCVYVFLYVRTSNRTWPLHLAGVAAVGYAVFALFSARTAEQGAAQLDRLVFLKTFLYEVRGWPSWEFLTGSFPLTPLSPGSCGSLSFYSLLFSRTDPGTCYSVIFHSFVLRAIFDHGVLGLVVLYGLLWLALRRSQVTLRDATALLGLITLSGFSVSAFNSVFATILLAVAMGLDRSTRPGDPPGATGPPAADKHRTTASPTRPRAGRPGGDRSAARRPSDDH